jgi:Transposase and inactivated derivatives
MTVKRRKFSREFKLQVVREVEGGKPQAQIAREHEISQQVISRWCRQHRRYKERAFSGNGRPHTDEAKLASLERKVGQLTMENDLLKKLLQKLEQEL